MEVNLQYPGARSAYIVIDKLTSNKEVACEANTSTVMKPFTQG